MAVWLQQAYCIDIIKIERVKKFIITGANGNLGTACVSTFLSAGHYVVAVDGKNDHLAFAGGHPNYSFATVDLNNEQTTNTFVQNVIATHGMIDGALMLVGGFAAGNIAATNGADLQKMFRLNFETAYFLARPLLLHLQQNGYGRLVFIGARPALAAEQGKDLLAYALTKSLLFTLAEFINEENKGRNISASVIVPSIIDTGANRSSMPEADPANWVTPQALADAIAFLVSDKGNALRETVLKVYNNA